MKVFDVVQIVDPGAMTSTEPGRWLVSIHTDGDSARAAAEKYNWHRSGCVLNSVMYKVEVHDELSPDRAVWTG